MATCSRCGKEAERTRDGAFTHDAFEGHLPTFAVVTADDATDEILDLAEEWADQYADGSGRVDWEQVWDRLDGMQPDDTLWGLDFGAEYDTPAMKKIQREVRKRRRG